MSGIIITNSLIIERSYILWWNKLNLFFVIWIPTLYLMWSTSLSKIKMKINEIYVISISIFFSLTLVTNLFINNVSYFNGKLEQLYGPFFYVFFIYYVSCLIYGLYLLNQASKLCDSLIERRRYLIVFIGTLIPIATSIILNSIIYIGKLRTFFHFDELTGNIYVLPITNSLMMILFAFAVLKYNFLKPDISIKEKLDTLRIKILYITNIIIIGLGIIISIIIINSGYPVDTTIIETIFVIVFLMFFIDIGINYSLSKYIKEKIIVPLGKISKHAEEVGKGNFNIKVGFEGEDEIAILSRQMDEMADKLNKTSMIRENFNKALQIEVQKTTEKLQEAYNQLKDSDKAKKDFIDAIAHELYNPLAIISLSNEYIQLDSIDPHNKKMITSIQRNIKRLIYLVKEIEDFTTIDLQDQKINVEKFDLEEMIKIIVQDFGILTSKKNIELSLKPIGQDFNLEGDKSKLTKVFVNLIENAVTFSNEDGKIKIIIEDRKENIEVKIEDNGIGIRKKDIKYIFEKFYRAEVDDVLRQGIGLGLPIARSIVINHDGIINVKSEYGKGSVFTVILPKKHVVL